MNKMFKVLVYAFLMMLSLFVVKNLTGLFVTGRSGIKTVSTGDGRNQTFQTVGFCVEGIPLKEIDSLPARLGKQTDSESRQNHDEDE